MSAKSGPCARRGGNGGWQCRFFRCGGVGEGPDRPPASGVWRAFPFVNRLFPACYIIRRILRKRPFLSNKAKTLHKFVIFSCESLVGILKSYTFALAFREHRHGGRT